MVKKVQKTAQKKMASSAKLLDTQLAATIKDSAQQIWLAGLGAFAKAQEEGNKVFETLVKEGVSLQKKTQALAEDRLSGVTSKVTHVAEGITGLPVKASQQWDKLETIFEQRVAKAQNKLGVPSRKDIDALSRRIDDLSDAVSKLAGKPLAAKSVVSKARKAASVGATRVKSVVRKAAA